MADRGTLLSLRHSGSFGPMAAVMSGNMTREDALVEARSHTLSTDDRIGLVFLREDGFAEAWGHYALGGPLPESDEFAAWLLDLVRNERGMTEVEVRGWFTDEGGHSWPREERVSPANLIAEFADLRAKVDRVTAENSMLVAAGNNVIAERNALKAQLDMTDAAYRVSCKTCEERARYRDELAKFVKDLAPLQSEPATSELGRRLSEVAMMRIADLEAYQVVALTRADLAEHMVRQLNAVLATAGAPEFSSAAHAHEWATETAKLRSQSAEIERINENLSWKSQAESSERRCYEYATANRVLNEQLAQQKTTIANLQAAIDRRRGGST